MCWLKNLIVIAVVTESGCGLQASESLQMAASNGMAQIVGIFDDDSFRQEIKRFTVHSNKVDN